MTNVVSERYPGDLSFPSWYEHMLVHHQEKMRRGSTFNILKGFCFLLSKRCNQQLGKESSKIWPFTATAQEVYFILWNTNSKTYVLYLVYHCMIRKQLCMLGLFHIFARKQKPNKIFLHLHYQALSIASYFIITHNCILLSSITMSQ